MTQATQLNHHLLIAMPAMQDPNFNQSVTYICEHNAYGAIGIVINRPTQLRLKHIFTRLDILVNNQQANEIPLLAGGPVRQEQGFIIHRPIGQWRSSLEVASDIAITTSSDILEAIAQGEGPTELLIALGYAGWGASQLEKEMMGNTWLSCPATTELLFKVPFGQRWQFSAHSIGVNINNLSSDIGHA